MKLKIATREGQREMNDAEQAEFISSRPKVQDESKKAAKKDKIDALIETLLSNGIISKDDADKITKG